MGLYSERRHDIQHNNTQHYGLICDTQHNDIEYNDTEYNDTEHNDTA